MKELFLKSVMGGLCIAIGACANMTVGGIAGGILFASGLCIILSLKYKLYTGMVGYVSDWQSVKECIVCIIGNCVGSSLLFHMSNERAFEIVSLKLANPPSKVICLSIICGVLIYAAVESWKQGNSLVTILLVSTFVLMGAEHSIADMCYVFMSNTWDMRIIPWILIVAFGNAIGALAARFISKLNNSNQN